MKPSQLDYEVNGQIESEWLMPTTPIEVPNTAEDRVNFVLKNSSTRAKSRKAMILRSHGELEVNKLGSKTPHKRILKPKNRNNETSAARAPFRNYGEYLNCKPARDKRSTSTRKNQKNWNTLLCKTTQPEEILETPTNRLSYNKRIQDTNSTSKPLKKSISSIQEISQNQRPDQPKHKLMNKESSKRSKKENQLRSKQKPKHKLVNMGKQIEVNLVNDHSEVSDEGSLVRNIYLNITAEKQEKKKQRIVIKDKSPKRIEKVSKARKTSSPGYAEKRFQSSKKAKPRLSKVMSSCATNQFKTIDARAASPSHTFKKKNEALTKEEERINRYVQSKKMKFKPNEKNTVSRMRPKDRIKALTTKLDEIMIKSQKLYDTYEALDYTTLLSRLNNVEKMYKRLYESNCLLQESNRMAFFFLNFYKDFETQLIYSNKLSNSQVIQTCQKIHKEYSCSILNFDIEKYEKCIEGNNSLLETYDPVGEFKDIKEKLDALNNEFLSHRSKEPDTIRDFSSIIPKDTSIMNSLDSENITGIGTYQEDRTRVATSNIDLTGYGETLSETEHIPPAKNDEFLTKVFSRKNILRTSYSQLETKVSSLEKGMGVLLKTEAQLKGEISRLKIERDGYKKLLTDNSYFAELQNSISGISTAILTNNSIGELKFNHQVMLKNLIDDELRGQLERQVL